MFWCEQLQIYTRVTKYDNIALGVTEICYLTLFHTEWV